jgi:hypothetical protein
VIAQRYSQNPAFCERSFVCAKRIKPTDDNKGPGNSGRTDPITPAISKIKAILSIG